ncbi:unnamed protein product [Knipowitschia caucasica]
MDKASGGQWKCARPVTQQTQQLLKQLMLDTRLTNVQKRQLRDCFINGTPLHLVCARNPPPPPPPQSKPKPCTSRGPKGKPQKRSADQCQAGGSYVRDRFKPGPTRDLEKEKRHLQKILAMGKDEPSATIKESPPDSEAPEEKDRVDELVEEIEERRQFLEDMASMGQEKHYVNVINTEISQRIRELKLLDRSDPSRNAAEECEGQKE